MKSNIDIDRISLEDRVNALEGRLPIGGSSSASGAWMLNPKVIDSCRDNEITELNDGFVAKIEIPNWGALQSPNPTIYPAYFNNLEVKMAMFFPLMNGIVMTCSQVFIRMRATANLTNLPPPKSGNTTIQAYCPLQDWSKITSKFGFGSTQVSVSFQSPTYYSGFIVLGNPAQQLATNVQILVSANTNTSVRPFMNMYAQGGVYSNSQNVFPSVGPSVSFGIAMLPPLTPMGIHAVHTPAFVVGSAPVRPNSIGFTGAQPSDLPAHLKPSYPDSWYA